MANPIKGELEFAVEDETYTIVLDANALCEAEAITGLSTPDLINQAGRKFVNAQRALLWGGLRRHHDGLSLADAGDIIAHLGLAGVDDVLGRAIQLAWPEPGSEKEGQEENPQPPTRKSAGGTGSRSTKGGSNAKGRR